MTQQMIRFLLGLTLLLSFSAGANSWDPFIGVFTGTAVADTQYGKQDRDITVKIQRVDNGFRVIWDTSWVKRSGDVKRDHYEIDFEPSARDGIFESRMKPGLFGGRQPLDPMKGEPYVWARIEAKTLTVYAMLITEVGDYEMQIYERTLVDGGMELHFTRYRRSEILSEVKTRLKRLP